LRAFRELSTSCTEHLFFDYAAKAGVNQFAQSVALQYASKGIRCNVVMQGVMNTPFIKQQISSQYESEADMIRARDAVCPMGAWELRGTLPM
jgi:NAD(P)-dependent dehydrogenase (short-subunit alcohol dehydrogenase family)